MTDSDRSSQKGLCQSVSGNFVDRPTQGKDNRCCFAFVVPRFGPDIGGGAETLVRELALKLAERGDAVDILATCARDNRTWANELEPGVYLDGGLRVYRFAVTERDLNIWVPIQISIHEGIKPGVDAQLDWLANSVNSENLYSFIINNSHRYTVIFFAPYLFGTTFWGSLIAPDKSMLIPCLHDENYAYLETIAAMFRSVRGCLFNASPEQSLADRLYGPVAGGVVGMGFEPFSKEYLENLSPYFGIEDRYIIYVGRKETGKSCDQLLDAFIAAKDGHQIASDLKLVLVGGGSFDDLHRPQARLRDDIIDIGFVSETDKHRLLKHAVALCQPSKNESFSIVLMEAWLLGTPVIVASQGVVTRDHVLKSNGGLYYESEQEFVKVLKEFLNNKALGKKLGFSGYQYVINHYNWSSVLDRFDKAVSAIFGSDKSSDKSSLAAIKQNPVSRNL
jgi:glycosyltransferase involved in cell wall biosynthesis